MSYFKLPELLFWVMCNSDNAGVVHLMQSWREQKIAGKNSFHQSLSLSKEGDSWGGSWCPWEAWWWEDGSIVSLDKASNWVRLGSAGAQVFIRRAGMCNYSAGCLKRPTRHRVSTFFCDNHMREKNYSISLHKYATGWLTVLYYI